MTSNAIEVRDLCKCYRLGDRIAATSLREALAHRLRRRPPQPGAEAEAGMKDIWSLRDVGFDLAEGEALGVIGRNGAGKSTLLKILTRITEPTSGLARTRGRVAAMLEVGTGFHPELTGRENVFLNGSILGMSRRDIASRFDSIVEFAGVAPFIDTPVKRFSSGMHLRLAFAVAAHVDPDILVVDEILAVGDAEFQQKCLTGMSAAGAEGRTLVFVSHDLDAISRLCRRSIWIDRGRVMLDGDTGEVLDAYLRSGREAAAGEGEPVTDPYGRVIVHSVQVLDREGRPVLTSRRDSGIAIEIDLTLCTRVAGFDIALYLVNRRGVRVMDEVWSDTAVKRAEGPGRFVARVAIPPVLNVGEYTVGLWLGTDNVEIIHAHPVRGFTIEGSDRGRPERVVELLLPWEVRPGGGNGRTPAAGRPTGARP